MNIRPTRLAAPAALLLLLAACAPALAQRRPPEITKIEPPSWWAGHSINPVRLLIRGSDLGDVSVRAADGAPLEAFGQTVNAGGNYMFLNLRISPHARPGSYDLVLSTPHGHVSRHPFRVERPLDPSKNFQGVNADDVIYLIMPDRFSNGDPSNDAPPGTPREANDRANPRAWHGGDFQGIINRLPYLKELGVTALWINPWYDNWNGVNRCEQPWCPNTYYHGYHAVDYYAVEDRFGTLEKLRELVERAHAHGIKVIQDQVANHVGSQHPWLAAPPLENWFHGTRERHERNPFRGDLLLSPHAPEAARRPTLDGWFSDDLPDMNQDEPEVARYEIQNALWWVGATGIDGIRQDTIQYMPRPFMRALSLALRRQYPRLWMVGEVFDRDPVHTAFFMGGREGWDGIDTQLDSVFDFPLWQASLDVFSNKAGGDGKPVPVSALRAVLRADAAYPDSSRLVTMASNHDVRRTASLPGMTLEGAMLHTAFILSVRGTPQLYYGDEIFMEGGEDPDNRRDFPGGWPADRRDAFTRAGRTEREQRMFEWTRDWIRLRREHEPLRRGRLVDLVSDEDSYAFARRTGTETIVVAFNRAATAKKISAPADFVDLPDGARLVPLLGAREGATVANGTLSLDVPARGAVAFRVVGPAVR